MNTEISTSNQQFSDSEIEGLLDAFSVETEVLTLKGQQDGRNNQPNSENFWRTGIFNPLQNKVQEIIDTIQQKLQPISGMVAQKMFNEIADKQIASIEPEIDNENLKAFRQEQIMKANCPNKVRILWRKIIHACIIIFGVFDGYLAYDAVRSGKMPFLASVVYGLAIMLLLCVGSIQLAAYAMKADTLPKRKARLYIGSALAAIIFAVLSYARASYYNNANHIDLNTDAANVSLPATSNISGLVLFVLSFGLFVFSLFLSMQVYKTKEEESREQAYNDAEKAYNDAVNNINEKTDLIAKIRRDTKDKIDHSNKVFEYAEGSKKRALGIGENGLAIYASANQPFRNDNQCPSYFSFPPKFAIRSFLDQVKAS